MKKKELLEKINEELLDKLYGFCYVRTNDSYEAQELCSDIVYELVRIGNTEGEIDDFYSFIWRVAKNIYADFSDKKKKKNEFFYQGNPNDKFIITQIKEENTIDDFHQLNLIYRHISFLTKAYREVMIQYYLDELSIKEIAVKQNISEVAVRQRLFSARKKIKNEVIEMQENKPILLDKIDFIIWGTGSPGWGDPRSVVNPRQFSKQIVYLCKNKAMSAIEIANKLNVPTIYVEEELEILTNGVNGEYGLLRKLENGKYIINFVLLDKNEMDKANDIYIKKLPIICDKVSKFIVENKDKFLAFPFINKKVDLNLIIWQQTHQMAYALFSNVMDILTTKYFSDYKFVSRPFSIFGYVNNGKYYGGGHDGSEAYNILGYKKIHIHNLYNKYLKKHFSCGHNLANDRILQLAIMAINGLEVKNLLESDKEFVAKAIECGYLYKDGDKLYTKILVVESENEFKLNEISNRLVKEYFKSEAEDVAKQMAEFIKNTIPEHLLPEWEFVNSLANLPIVDSLIENLINRNIIVAPEDGIGAEGCWMIVQK